MKAIKNRQLIMIIGIIAKALKQTINRNNVTIFSQLIVSQMS